MEKTENLVKFREEFDFLKKMEDLKMEDKKKLSGCSWNTRDII